MEWALLPLKRYAEFSGRSRRKEYWMFFLLMLAANFAVGILGTILGDLIEMVLSLLLLVAFLIPGIAVGIRRLHDTGRSGWWLLISLIPIVGSIILIVFLASDGTRGPNEYGPDPKLEGGGIAERFA
ncbi:DUF805 domain-containing protein [Sphingomonas parva]|uniref:DUF805 domain-containing protein n=1 Tax=Sphingomonas parva TaxID=2555898 RepID=A0A4Y8ZLH7_9SPHN|nr:DUF805 domain-containing protein [Sphingomonas parva]TFI56861.1 DUF805 domain-containing protein [Sphingomonas parva]